MQRPLVFADGRLIGILSEPARRKDVPAVVILNAGLVYRVGPGRLSVDVAQRALSLGFPTFRFDLSGIGDSDVLAPSMDSIESAIVDTREALDALGRELGVQQFILFGLCSGAVYAHHIAVADARVVGAVMLDGYVLPTVRSRLDWLVARARPFDQLPRRAAGWVSRRVVRTRSRAPALERSEFLVPWPSKDKLKADLGVLGPRKAALLCVYSGEWLHYRYQGQLQAALGVPEAKGLVSEIRIPEAEHLYLDRTQRNRMLDHVGDWLAHFPWCQ